MATRSRRASFFPNASGRRAGAALLLLGAALALRPSTAVAVGGPDLRWIPSSSPGITGYMLYVGSETDFFAAGRVDAAIDIGRDFTLEDGIAHHPLGDLISEGAWLVMTAYGSTGESGPSNEIFAVPPQACTADVDCDDGNACNGSETCSGGTCTGDD